MFFVFNENQYNLKWNIHFYFYFKILDETDIREMN